MQIYTDILVVWYKLRILREMLFSSHSLLKHAGKYWWTIMLDLAAPLRIASDKHIQAFLSEKKNKMNSLSESFRIL